MFIRTRDLETIRYRGTNSFGDIEHVRVCSIFTLDMHETCRTTIFVYKLRSVFVYLRVLCRCWYDARYLYGCLSILLAGNIVWNYNASREHLGGDLIAAVKFVCENWRPVIDWIPRKSVVHLVNKKRAIECSHAERKDFAFICQRLLAWETNRVRVEVIIGIN